MSALSLPARGNQRRKHAVNAAGCVSPRGPKPAAVYPLLLSPCKPHRGPRREGVVIGDEYHAGVRGLTNSANCSPMQRQTSHHGDRAAGHRRARSPSNSRRRWRLHRVAIQAAPKSSEHLREDVDRRVVLGFMGEFADDVDVLDDAAGIRDEDRPRQEHQLRNVDAERPAEVPPVVARD